MRRWRAWLECRTSAAAGHRCRRSAKDPSSPPEMWCWLGPAGPGTEHWDALRTRTFKTSSFISTRSGLKTNTCRNFPGKYRPTHSHCTFDTWIRKVGKTKKDLIGFKMYFKKTSASTLTNYVNLLY